MGIRPGYLTGTERCWTSAFKDLEANLDTGKSWDVVRIRLRDKLRQR